MALENIRVVLVDPQHPGNIGAVARAMNTMGLDQLFLVRPREYPSYEADRRASGSVDLLQRARVVGETKEAVADCRLVIGSTARSRTYSLPVLDARRCGQMLVSEAATGVQVAVIFGPERTGLANRDLDLCNYSAKIPTSEAFSSLNLASAVQLIGYEILMASLAASPDADAEVAPTNGPDAYPSQAEMEFFYQHLARTLDERKFTIDERREATLAKLRRLFGRARPRQREIKMLHSLVRLMQRDEDS